LAFLFQYTPTLGAPAYRGGSISNVRPVAMSLDQESDGRATYPAAENQAFSGVSGKTGYFSDGAISVMRLRSRSGRLPRRWSYTVV
jgi:hypothetical protein